MTITTDDRHRLVLISADECDRLRFRERRAIRPEELSEGDLALIATAEAPAEHAHLDAELADWRP